MNQELKNKIENNLFPLARPAIEPWEKFPWHLDRSNLCDTWKIHSSQALAIDVFGTLMMLEQSSRDAIFDSVCKNLNVPPGGPWQVHLEWLDPTNLLKEPRPTQVDAVAVGQFAFILFEVKFTERQAGCCSQTMPLARVGQAQCNGNFELQVNPANRILDRCALTGKGIRYWELVPQIFRLNAGDDYRPCPFAGSAVSVDAESRVDACHCTSNPQIFIVCDCVYGSQLTDQRLPQERTVDWVPEAAPARDAGANSDRNS